MDLIFQTLVCLRQRIEGRVSDRVKLYRVGRAYFLYEKGLYVLRGKFDQRRENGRTFTDHNWLRLRFQDVLQGRHDSRVLQVRAVGIQQPVHVVLIDLREVGDQDFARRAEIRPSRFFSLCELNE